MSMINVEINTEEGTMDIKIDGVALSNVKSIHAYLCEYEKDELRLNICSKTMNDDGSLEYYNMISLAEDGLVKSKQNYDPIAQVVSQPKEADIIVDNKSIAKFLRSKLV